MRIQFPVFVFLIISVLMVVTASPLGNYDFVSVLAASGSDDSSGSGSNSGSDKGGSNDNNDKKGGGGNDNKDNDKQPPPDDSKKSDEPPSTEPVNPNPNPNPENPNPVAPPGEPQPQPNPQPNPPPGGCADTASSGCTPVGPPIIPGQPPTTPPPGGPCPKGMPSCTPCEGSGCPLPPPGDPDKTCLFKPEQEKCKSKDGTCPEGFFHNGKDSCVPQHDRCPKGFHSHEDDETGQCISDKVPCDKNFVRDPDFPTCSNKERVCRDHPKLDFCLNCPIGFHPDHGVCTRHIFIDVHRTIHSSNSGPAQSMSAACFATMKLIWLGKIQRGQNQETDQFIDRCLSIIAQ